MLGVISPLVFNRDLITHTVCVFPVVDIRYD